MKYKLKLIEKHLGWGAKDPRTGKLMSKYTECKEVYTPALGKGGSLITGFVDNDMPDEVTKEVHPLAKKRQSLESQLGFNTGQLFKSSLYWNTDFKFIIPEGGLEIDTEEALGLLRFTVLSADPDVAMTLDDAENKHNCKWSLLTDEIVSKEKNAKRSVKYSAIAALQKLTKAQVIDVLSLYGIDCSDTDHDTNFNMLSEYVEKQPKLFLDRSGDKDLKLKATINIALKKGVITREGLSENSVHRFMGNDLGFGVENVISFLKAVENQAVYAEISKQIKK